MWQSGCIAEVPNKCKKSVLSELQNGLSLQPAATPQMPVGKGLYPIFAIMSHHCVCNARYMINPNSDGGGFAMYVRARRSIRKGEEISVQYLSALYGNFKRRKKIKVDRAGGVS